MTLEELKRQTGAPVIVANHQGVVTEVNAAFEQVFGWKAAEIQGKPLTTIIPPSFHDSHHLGFSRFLTTGKPTLLNQPLKLKAITKDGRIFDAEHFIVAEQVAGQELMTNAVADATCMTSAGAWQSRPLASQSGTFVLEFDATPLTARQDGVIGVSRNPATSYGHLAAIVRFNTAGFIDARNGVAYTAQTPVPYTANALYHVRMVISVPAHTYSVYVKTGGGLEQAIGLNYQFRAEQHTATLLNSLSAYASIGSLKVCQPVVSIATVPPPVSVTSQGTWQSIPLAPFSGQRTVMFDVIPNLPNSDGVIGLSNGVTTSYGGLATIVRFNTAGRIDARNGGVYAAQTQVPYVVGAVHHVRLVVNVIARTYSIYVRCGNGPEQAIGLNYRFRTEQQSTSTLKTLNAYASVGSVTVSNPTLSP